MNNSTKNIPESPIHEYRWISDEITKLRRENITLKISRSGIGKQQLKIKLDEFCRIKCPVLCKSKEKLTKEECIIKKFIDDLGK